MIPQVVWNIWPYIRDTKFYHEHVLISKLLNCRKSMLKNQQKCMKWTVSFLSFVFILILSIHVHRMCLKLQVLCLHMINCNDKRISILYKMSQQFFFLLWIFVHCIQYTQKTVNKTWFFNYVVIVSVRL